MKKAKHVITLVGGKHNMKIVKVFNYKKPQLLINNTINGIHYCDHYIPKYRQNGEYNGHWYKGEVKMKIPEPQEV